MTKINTFHDACRAVLADADNHKGNMPYARAYAKAGLHITVPDAQRTQALYVLTNLSHWRHADAKAVRAFLKEFTK